MKKIRTWVLVITFIIFLIAWGVMGYGKYCSYCGKKFEVMEG